MAKRKLIVLNDDELAARALKCATGRLCFVSLEPIEDKPAELVKHPVCGFVYVLKEYIRC